MKNIGTMKIFRLLALAIPISFILLCSCTKIDAPYALVKVSSIKDTVYDWSGLTPVNRVLLEDYTGHKCVNCPEATILAENMAGSYEGKLVLLAVHAGIFAVPGSTGDFTADYRSAAGEKWANDFGIVSNPNGLINRKAFNGSVIVGKDLWSDAVTALINQAPDAQMLINTIYDDASGKVTATVLARFLNPLTGGYKITLCLTEDSLVSPQKNSNPAVGPVPVWYNYRFNNVLRGAINGTDGEMLTDQVNTSKTLLGRFTFKLNAAWIPAHCNIYAFIYNSATKEIVQVEKVSLLSTMK